MIIYYFSELAKVDEEVVSRLLPKMPEEQREQILKMKSFARRREQVLSYIILAYALKNNVEQVDEEGLSIVQFGFPELESLLGSNTQLPALRFRFGEHGKPYLTNDEGVYFNISHCGVAVAVAVGKEEVGIDIEGRRRFSESVIERAYNEEEKALVRGSAEPELEFARIWTRKEAWFKYTGTGILMDQIKTTETDASAAGCAIQTQLISPEGTEPFWLSVVRKDC